MKTELALLMLTDGRPSMTLEELAKLRNIDPRTALNQIHAKRFPIPVWKDGAGYFAHVGDVAKWLDGQREQAARDSQADTTTSSSAGMFSRRRGARLSGSGSDLRDSPARSGTAAS
jgi:Pyocin activator protein PrtN